MSFVLKHAQSYPKLRKEFIRYTTLSVLGTVGVSCYILADTWFIAGGLGSNGLTALNLAIPVYSFLAGLGMMLGMGGATQFSLAGPKEPKQRKTIYTCTLVLGLLLSLPFILTALFGAEQLASLLGADAEVLADTTIYVKYLMLFSPAFMANYILQAFLRNDGSPHLSTWAMVGGSFFNIVFDWVFIFPCHMGMFGAILATVLSPVVSVLIMLPHFSTKRNTLHLSSERPSSTMIVRDFSLGFPSLITQVSAGIVMLVLNSIFLKLAGNIGVAAYGVIANLSCVVSSVSSGIAQGMQPLASDACSKDEMGQARACLRYGLIAVLIFALLLCLTTLLFPGPIAASFNRDHDPVLQQIAIEGLQLFFLSTPFAGICIILSTWFASVQDPKPAHIISLLRGLILVVPFAYLFTAVWGMTGAWLAVPVSEALSALIGWLLYRQYLHKHPMRIQNQQ